MHWNNLSFSFQRAKIVMDIVEAKIDEPSAYAMFGSQMGEESRGEGGKEE